MKTFQPNKNILKKKKRHAQTFLTHLKMSSILPAACLAYRLKSLRYSMSVEIFIRIDILTTVKKSYNNPTHNMTGSLKIIINHRTKAPREMKFH